MEQLSEKLYCHTCKRKTNHGIKSKVTKHAFIMEFYICECLGCDTYTFVFGSFNTVENKPYFLNVSSEYEQVFQDEFDITIRGPMELFNLFQSTVFNYKFNEMLFAVVGIRMMIELICKDIGIQKGVVIDERTGELIKKNNEILYSKSLKARIDMMEYIGIISKNQKYVLQSIRELGNTGVHEFKEPQIHIIKIALDIISQISKMIYDYEEYKHLISEAKNTEGNITK